MLIIYQKQLPDGAWETISAPLDFDRNKIAGLLPYLKTHHGNVCIRVIDEHQNVILNEDANHSS